MPFESPTPPHQERSNEGPQEAQERDRALAEIDTVLRRYALLEAFHPRTDEERLRHQEEAIRFMETIRTSVRTAYGVDIQSNPGIDSFAISNGVSGPMVDSPPEAAHGIRLIAEELCKYPPRLVRSIPHLSMQVRQTVSSRDRPIPRSSREIHRKDGFSVCTATESKAWIALTQESVDREKGSKRPIFSSAPLKDQEIRDTVHHELAHILAFHQEAALRGSERMWSRLKIMDGSAKEKTDEYRAVMVAGFIVSEDLDLKEQNAASADFLRRVSSGIMGEQYFNDLRAGRVNATYWIGR